MMPNKIVEHPPVSRHLIDSFTWGLGSSALDALRGTLDAELAIVINRRRKW